MALDVQQVELVVRGTDKDHMLSMNYLGPMSYRFSTIALPVNDALADVDFVGFEWQCHKSKATAC